MKTVVFVCERNTVRSQIAEGLFNAKAPRGWQARSAGTNPSPRQSPDPEAVLVMRELGIDISKSVPKGFRQVEPASVILVVSLHGKKPFPEISGAKSLSWAIATPRPGDLQQYKELRDNLRKRIDVLVRALSEQTTP